ncbi:hypothetical protein FJD36_06995 [Pseudomonas chlororaphis subsp. chlororaphis]|nr:hypothetical protein FJD36_06995 [Pseudomonas chlororaphis subsp. chlororaphis]
MPRGFRVCTKSRRAKVRQGKNRRGTAGVAFDFRGLNEHSEPVFNAAWPSAATFRTEPSGVRGQPRYSACSPCRR